MSSASALRTVSDREYLRNAWKEISKKNKRSKGLDNVTIKAFKDHLDENLSQISSELRTNTYQFNKLRAHAINKPGSKKQRPLQIATVRDRVVMKALAVFIEPAFQPFNQDCSFAFIKDRGVNRAIKRIQELVAQGNRFYFEADIMDFFGSVDRPDLWKKFSRTVRHKSLLGLLERCFNLELQDLQGYEPEFQSLFFGADSGIPQGGVLSAMLANFYLYEFDRSMLEHRFNLVRYADDFVVMCESRERAKEAHDLSKATLESLELNIHPLGPESKSRIGDFSKEGLMFLGLRFEGRDVFPAKKVITRFEGKVEEVLKPSSGESLFKTLQRLTNLINGWGKCYKAMRVTDIYLRLDESIKNSVEKYLRGMGIQLVGKNKRRPMKLFGIPSLAAMVEHTRRPSPSAPPVGTPRRNSAEPTSSASP